METLHITDAETPIGRLRFASTDRGLAFVELPKADGCGLRGWIHQQLRGARCRDARGPNEAAIAQISEYLEGARTEFDLPLDLRGTTFQLQVWEALRAIPFGECRSYRDIAVAVGRPRAVRAVGTANGSNPVPLVVPCHRVINADGKLGGYGGGLSLKAQLLELEARASDTRLF